MADLLPLRLRNIFQPSPTFPSGNAGAISPDDQNGPYVQGFEPNDMESLMNSYNPRTALSTQLTTALGQMPQRPQPSRLQNIFGGIAGLGAGSSPEAIVGGQPIGFKFNPQAAKIGSDEIKYGDYNNQLGDWQAKIRALGIGAGEEDRYNTNERIRANNEMQNVIKQQEADTRTARAKSYDDLVRNREKVEADKHETAMQRLRDNITIADKKLAQAAEVLKAKKGDYASLDKHRQAEIEAIQARHNFEMAEASFKNEQALRLNESIIERNRILNESRTEPKETNTEITGRDINGQPTGIRRTTGPLVHKTRMLASDGVTEVDVPDSKVQDFIDNYGGTRKQ